MAHAYASTVIDAPVEAVWATARDFSALPSWVSVVESCIIEDGLAPDAVGCVRHMKVGGNTVRERLLYLDDSHYRFGYNFDTPAFPVEHYRAWFELIPVTAGDRCFAQWGASFDEAPGDAGKYQEIISRDVFAAGLAGLARSSAGRTVPEKARRWQGLRPAKVFCSSVIHAPLDAVWAMVRAFDGMGGWHPDVERMHMLAGARADQVSGVRDFSIHGGHLQERLTYLSDTEHAFRYTIEESPFPWLDYHAGARFYPVSDTERTLGVWTADWVAAPQDDVALIPSIHETVFQKAFDTLSERLHRA